MAGFWEAFGIGAIAGAAGTELCKQVTGSFFKRRDERGSERRKLIRGDLDALEKKVEPLVKLALLYFSNSSAAGAGDARQIKADLKAFATRWNAVSALMGEAGIETLPIGALISFRRSLTQELDTSRAGALSPNDAIIESVSTGAISVLSVLTAARYRAV